MACSSGVTLLFFDLCITAFRPANKCQTAHGSDGIYTLKKLFAQLSTISDAGLHRFAYELVLPAGNYFQCERIREPVPNGKV